MPYFKREERKRHRVNLNGAGTNYNIPIRINPVVLLLLLLLKSARVARVIDSNRVFKKIIIMRCA